MTLPSLPPLFCLSCLLVPSWLWAQAPEAPATPSQAQNVMQSLAAGGSDLEDLLARRQSLAAREAELADAFKPAAPEQLARLAALESDSDLTPEQRAWMKDYLAYFADFIQKQTALPPPLPADTTPHVRIAKVATEARILATPDGDIEMARLPEGGEILQLAIIPSLSSAMVMLADGRLGFLQSFTLNAYDPSSDSGPSSSAFRSGGAQ